MIFFSNEFYFHKYIFTFQEIPYAFIPLSIYQYFFFPILINSIPIYDIVLVPHKNNCFKLPQFFIKRGLQ